MKIVSMLLVFTLLCGCTAGDKETQMVTDFRQDLLMAKGCTFDTSIVADYGDMIYQFEMSCQMDSEGAVEFTVTSPETISGISGTIGATGGHFDFEETILAFPVLADGQAAPVTAPWIFLNSLRSGYIVGCGREGEGYRISVDDSYEENPLHLEITTDDQLTPNHCDIYCDGRRILNLEIKAFQIQ